MGDRANIHVKDSDEDSGVWLYTHWGGSNLPVVLQEALERQERWDDSQYLTRIIFSHMIRNDIDGATGYGISSCMWDGSNQDIVVNVRNQTVTYRGRVFSFEEFLEEVF